MIQSQGSRYAILLTHLAAICVTTTAAASDYKRETARSSLCEAAYIHQVSLLQSTASGRGPVADSARLQLSELAFRKLASHQQSLQPTRGPTEARNGAIPVWADCLNCLGRSCGRNGNRDKRQAVGKAAGCPRAQLRQGFTFLVRHGNQEFLCSAEE